MNLPQQHKNAIVPVVYKDGRTAYRTQVGTGKNRRFIQGNSEAVLLKRLCEYYGTEKPTMGSMMTQYVDDLKIRGKSFSRITKVQNAWNRYLADDWEDMPVEALNPVEIRTALCAAFRGPQKDGKETTQSAIKDTVQLAHNLIRRAIDLGIVAYDAMQTVTPSEFYEYAAAVGVRKIRSKDFECERQDVYAPKEIEALRADMADAIAGGQRPRTEPNNPHAYGVLIATYTGMRAGELPVLRWEDVHWEERYLWVHRQQVKLEDTKPISFKELPYTKDERKKGRKKGRHVPMSKELIDVLAGIRKYQEEAGIETDYILAWADGSNITKDSYEQFLERHSKALKLHCCNNHGIRKYFNSYVLIPKGFPLARRSEIMGHSPEVNLRHYTVTSDADTLSEEAALLDA